MSVQFEAAGSGPAVVLVHCALCDSRQWDREFAAWAGEFRVIRHDVAGWGRSPLPSGPFSHAEDLLGVLDRLGVERAAIVGNSMGGGIALDVALAAPERVWALVLVDAGYPGWEWSQPVTRYNEEEDALLAAGDVDAAVELNLRTWLDGPNRGPDAVDPQLRARIGEMQRLAFEVFLAAEAEPGPQRRPEEAPAEVRCPTLIVAGDEDQPDILASAERYEQEIPGARMVVIPGAAHIPNLERPQEFDRLVLGFLRSLGADRSRV